MQYVVLIGVVILVIICLPIILPILGFVLIGGLICAIIHILSSNSNENKSLEHNDVESKSNFQRTKIYKNPNNITSSSTKTTLGKNQNTRIGTPIRAKVVGVTFNNRQSHIKELESGDGLTLRRESNNPYDKNAIAIYDISRNQLGYIPKYLAETLADKLDSGIKYDCKVIEVIGGGSLNYGLVIEIILYKNSPQNNLNKPSTTLSDNDKLMLVQEVETSDSFYQFVSNIDERLLKSVISSQYQELKEVNKFEDAHMGINGCIEFVGDLLLINYTNIKKQNETFNVCIKSIDMAFKGFSPGMFSDSMDLIINEYSNISYDEWSSVYRYLDSHHGYWIRLLEFAQPYDAQDHKRFKINFPDFPNYKS